MDVTHGFETDLKWAWFLPKLSGKWDLRNMELWLKGMGTGAERKQPK
jgi:hypothetical protein